ncbi:MAG: ABC transporter permease [Leptospiraceae bacterium]|nr:ABC transporter permease [Leptospiraceae bacterium]MBK9498799.1 ABC transporter permease [Leptospiraceae bacterium]MBP9162602.1 ABC transporter permease [Leptospiraceae bacterium]
MNIISLITFRYIRGSRVFGLLSLKSRLSFIVMMVGVSLLIVVLSIFNGFQRQVKESLWSGGPHITIENTQGSGEIQKYERMVELLLQNPTLKERVISMQGNITSHGLLQNNNTFVPVMIRAVPIPNEEELVQNQVPNFPKLEYYNREDIKELNSKNLVVIGKEMSLLYNYNLGRGITLAVPSGSFNVSRGVELNISSFAVTGLFKTGYYNYDSKFIFMSLPTAQKFFKMKNSVNQITVKVKSLDDLQYCKQLILQTIGSSDFDSSITAGAYFSVRTIAEEQANFLGALRMEKTIISNIVFLFIVLAALGMVATVYSLVRSKRKSIGTLKALGLPSSSILLIFTLNSMIIGLFASIIGGIIGIYYANNLESIIDGLSEVINTFGRGLSKSGEWRDVKLVPKDIYYFDHLPVDIDISFIFMVTTAATILSGLAGYFPARWAANLDPVETIKND